MDRLEALLMHFTVSARMFHSGALCGINDFEPQKGLGQLHLLQAGELQIEHQRASIISVIEPSLLFYPRPYFHRFVSDEKAGAALTCAHIQFNGGVNNPLVQALPAFLILPLSELGEANLLLDILFREAFDQRKVRAGFDRALQKRAVAEDKIEAAVRAVVHQLRISGEREVPSIKVGEFVMNELRKLDHVGYVRFASVYRSFEDVADFREEIEKLERELPSSTEQLQLLGDVIALTKKKKG